MMPRPMIPTVPLVAITQSPPMLLRAALLSLRGCGRKGLFRAHGFAYRPVPRHMGANMHVGVAGLGMMGAAIAQRLIEVGHTVTVWNRTADKVEPVVAAGATAAATPRALAGACELIITI